MKKLTEKYCHNKLKVQVEQKFVSLSFKRFFDVLVSFSALILLLPLFLILSVCVKLDSKGPIFFRQERLGAENSVFIIVKFRTLRVDGEYQLYDFVTTDDQRITRIGHFFRRNRLDELPQLWNVLIGEMSLVGPRPEQVGVSAWLEQEIPYFELRRLMRPGITGWAQVNQNYASTLEEMRVKLAYDLNYIENFSLLFDFKILRQTIVKFL